MHEVTNPDMYFMHSTTQFSGTKCFSLRCRKECITTGFDGRIMGATSWTMWNNCRNQEDVHCTNILANGFVPMVWQNSRLVPEKTSKTTLQASVLITFHDHILLTSSFVEDCEAKVTNEIVLVCFLKLCQWCNLVTPQIAGPHDGTVTVAETLLPNGMVEAYSFKEVHAAHAWIMQHPHTIASVINFIRTGGFKPWTNKKAATFSMLR